MNLLPELPPDEQARAEQLYAADQRDAKRRLKVFGPTVTVPSTPDQPADEYAFEPDNPWDDLPSEAILDPDLVPPELSKHGCPCHEQRPRWDAQLGRYVTDIPQEP